MRWIAGLVLFLGVTTGLAAWTNYFELDGAAFKAAAAQEVRSERVNDDLMAAAILRETNERRREHGLAALKYNAKATEAAKIQSDIMRARGGISHVNPESPKYRTLELRVKVVGLNYRLIAENVATAFGIQYESGKPYFPDRANGQTIIRYKPGGPEIPRHTYATFAKALVDAWMNSKGHRENILRKEAECLGAYCAPGNSKANEVPIFYCTQVFVTEMDSSKTRR